MYNPPSKLYARPHLFDFARSQPYFFIFLSRIRQAPLSRHVPALPRCSWPKGGKLAGLQRHRRTATAYSQNGAPTRSSKTPLNTKQPQTSTIDTELFWRRLFFPPRPDKRGKREERRAKGNGKRGPRDIVYDASTTTVFDLRALGPDRKKVGH